MREAFKFIQKILGKSPLTGAEIGVREGKNALSIVNSNFVGRLYLVDHYLPHTESSGNEISQVQQEAFYAGMFKNLHPFINKLVFVSVSSSFASTLFDNEFFDFVYIDGGHSYWEVQNDIKRWLPKVKKGGIISGHDFKNPKTPDVPRAVKDFFHSVNLPVNALDDSDWAVINC